MFRHPILYGAAAGLLAMGAAGATFAQYTFNTGLTSSDAEARSIHSTISGEFGAVKEAEKAARQGQELPVDRYARSVARAVEPAGGYRASITYDEILPASYWQGSSEAWQDHMNACLNRYRTYDPYTDQYFVRAGVRQRCTVAMVGSSNPGP